VDSGPKPTEPKPQTFADLLAARVKEEEGFLGTDPRIAKMKEALSKQGEEGGLDRAMRGLQYILAGEQIKQKGDTTQLEKITQSEMARRKEMADRQMKLAELEGVDYQRKRETLKGLRTEEGEKAKTKADQKFRAGESKLDRASRLAAANIPAKELQVAQRIMKDKPGTSYLEAIRQASEAMSPKDTYNANRNALTKAAEAANEEMKNREFFNPKIRELSEKALAGDPAAQIEYNNMRNEVEKRIFKQFQVDGMNLRSGNKRTGEQSPAASTTFTEGQTAKDIKGKTIVFKNGQWVYP
jgi:hypothetical protein